MYGFQPFTLNVLKISPSENALLFTMFGALGFLTQTTIVGRFSKIFGLKKALSTGIVWTAFALLAMYFSRSLIFFVAASALLAVFNSIVQTLLPTILSQESDAKSQGTIMGLNASYQSIGMIFGPILGGAVAAYSEALPFLVGAALIGSCYFIAKKVLRPGIKKESAF
jgi:DHA1 family multidrug resistance protein-like MFS transporter